MVSYVDAAGQTVNRKVSKYSVDAETPGRARALIGGFTDTNEYEFTLTAYSYAGNASTPVTVKGTPEDCQFCPEIWSIFDTSVWLTGYR